jgi:Holliday junction resolvase RusA-like endonuclease
MTASQTPSAAALVAAEGTNRNAGPFYPAADAGITPCPAGESPAASSSWGSDERTTAAGPVLDFYVVGVPSQQGSKRGYIVNGRVNITEDSKKTRPWRDAVKHAALDASGRHRTAPLLDGGPVRIVVTFVLPRPRGHYRTGRNAHLLRDAAPRWPAVKPDADKMWRLVGDSLKDAAVYRDDAQVVQARISKVYADGQLPGAHIRIYRVGDDQ